MEDVWLVTSWQVVIMFNVIIIITVVVVVVIIIIMINIVIIIRPSSGCESRPPNQSSSLLSRSTATMLIDPRDVQVQRSVGSSLDDDRVVMWRYLGVNLGPVRLCQWFSCHECGAFEGWLLVVSEI